MHSFRYRDSYNMSQAATMGLGALFIGGYGWTSGHLVTLLLAAVFLGCAILAASRIGSSEPALSFDDERVTVRTPFGVSTFPWTDVSSIYLQTKGASNIATIPFGGSLCVCFQTSGSGLIGGRVWLGTGSIELPPGGPGALLDMLNHTWRAATGLRAEMDASADPQPI